MAGIYIHIPFCKQACTYCDFHFSTSFEVYHQNMVDAICQEIVLSKDYFKPKDTISTIYFGGGTPSLLNENELNRIFEQMHQTFNLRKVEEITLEANPDDIDKEKLKIWKVIGINRLSIGIQSFRQVDLDWMNRAHNTNEAEQSIVLAQKYGFDNLSVDLIYGLPDLDLKTWEKHIQKVVDYNIPHISAYCLTVEPKTVLNKLVKTHQISLPNDEMQAKHFEFLIQFLASNGYEQYEISNFSKPELHSKHNSNYWKNQKYLGLGPSAHSYDLNNRRWNISNNQQYIKKISEEKHYFELEQLTKENRFNEMIMTGLRTKWGVDLDKLKQIAAPTKHFWNQVAHFERLNDLKIEKNTVLLTPSGKLKADYVASELFL